MGMCVDRNVPVPVCVCVCIGMCLYLQVCVLHGRGLRTCVPASLLREILQRGKAQPGTGSHGRPQACVFPPLAALARAQLPPFYRKGSRGSERQGGGLKVNAYSVGAGIQTKTAHSVALSRDQPPTGAQARTAGFQADPGPSGSERGK